MEMFLTLVRIAGVCSGVDDFNSGGLFLTAELLKQGCGCHGVRKAFSEFCHGRSELIVECSVGLRTLLQQACRGLCFVVIWFINSNELLGNLVLVVNSGGLSKAV